MGTNLVLSAIASVFFLLLILAVLYGLSESRHQDDEYPDDHMPGRPKQ